MGKELFKVETLKHIQSRLDYIYSTAKTHHQHQHGFPSSMLLDPNNPIVDMVTPEGEM